MSTVVARPAEDRRRLLIWLPALLIAAIVLPLAASTLLYVAQGGTLGGNWRLASRNPTGQAPDPATTPQAVVQVYSARAFGWRGAVGVHLWYAVKPAGAQAYTRAEVMGFGVSRGIPALRIVAGVADQEWFGNRPDLLLDMRGEAAAKLIPRILAAAEAYPYHDRYTIWPGPNSNSFVAHVARAVPELGLELPANAIGKDYLGENVWFGRAPSGTGWQVSLFGAFGVMLAIREGIEINLLGFVFGIDPDDLTIKLPGLGNLRLTGASLGRAEPRM